MRKTKVESERITNLSELEQIIQSARSDAIYLKKAIEDDNKEASAHLVKQIDLKLHQLEAFEFNIERRTVTVEDHRCSLEEIKKALSDALKDAGAEYPPLSIAIDGKEIYKVMTRSRMTDQESIPKEFYREHE